jgi:hypothetical protein
VNCEAQRFDSGVPAFVLKPELTFEKQAGPDSEFHTVRLHGDTKEILLRIVRQPFVEAKPDRKCRTFTAAWRIPLWLLSEWGCRGRRLSRESENLCRQRVALSATPVPVQGVSRVRTSAFRVAPFRTLLYPFTDN